MAHVLVIDDDRTVLALVSNILEAHGHQVSTAQDGREGMKVFDKGHVELVVTDIVMPGQEGMATIDAIRRISRKVPILAMSGSYTLAKPITVDGLMRAVDRLLAEPVAGV